jgi:hypothetical protein
MNVALSSSGGGRMSMNDFRPHILPSLAGTGDDVDRTQEQAVPFSKEFASFLCFESECRCTMRFPLHCNQGIDTVLGKPNRFGALLFTL